MIRTTKRTVKTMSTIAIIAVLFASLTFVFIHISQSKAQAAIEPVSSVVEIEIEKDDVDSTESESESSVSSEMEEKEEENTSSETLPVVSSKPVSNYTTVNHEVYVVKDTNVYSNEGVTAIDTLAKGDAVTRTAMSTNGWSKITYDGKTGYAKGKTGYVKTAVLGANPFEKNTESSKNESSENKPSKNESSKSSVSSQNTKSSKENPTVSSSSVIADTASNESSGKTEIANNSSVVDVTVSVNSTPAPAEKEEHIHKYDEKVIKATCLTDGYTVFTCECGDAYNGNVTKKVDHDYLSEVVEPTTEKQGYTLHICKGCGESYKDTYTDKVVIKEESKKEAVVVTDDSNESTEIVDPETKEHQHETMKVGGYTYIYCENVEEPYRDGFNVYYPIEYFY